MVGVRHGFGSMLCPCSSHGRLLLFSVTPCISFVSAWGSFCALASVLPRSAFAFPLLAVFFLRSALAVSCPPRSSWTCLWCCAPCSALLVGLCAQPFCGLFRCRWCFFWLYRLLVVLVGFPACQRRLVIPRLAFLDLCFHSMFPGHGHVPLPGILG